MEDTCASTEGEVGDLVSVVFVRWGCDQKCDFITRCNYRHVQGEMGSRLHYSKSSRIIMAEMTFGSSIYDVRHVVHPIVAARSVILRANNRRNPAYWNFFIVILLRCRVHVMSDLIANLLHDPLICDATAARDEVDEVEVGELLELHRLRHIFVEVSVVEDANCLNTSAHLGRKSICEPAECLERDLAARIASAMYQVLSEVVLSTHVEDVDLPHEHAGLGADLTINLSEREETRHLADTRMPFARTIGLEGGLSVAVLDVVALKDQLEDPHADFVGQTQKGRRFVGHDDAPAHIVTYCRCA